MKNYRVSKYNPSLRINGKYSIDEWTSFSDIGKMFNNVRLTVEDYNKVESSYIGFIRDVILFSNAAEVQITHLENPLKLKWEKNQLLSIREVQMIAKDCLRERCWAKLVAKELFIHFGYDYYIYIGTSINEDKLNNMAETYGLFMEECISPYL